MTHLIYMWGQPDILTTLKNVVCSQMPLGEDKAGGGMLNDPCRLWDIRVSHSPSPLVLTTTCEAGRVTLVPKGGLERSGDGLGW